jgi:hypothetical protein
MIFKKNCIILSVKKNDQNISTRYCHVPRDDIPVDWKDHD